MTLPQHPEGSPVAAEFGFEPLKPRELVIPPITSWDPTDTDLTWRDGSEFGGTPGLIQPPPHVPTASERLMMVYAIDPTDDGTRPDSVTPPELDGAF